ncbi:MAG: hypothetical protein JNK22_06760 [Rhodocyclaceae bacterium]|nr:hypothetical protein [Rhodocyclaceae bacterium]
MMNSAWVSLRKVLNPGRGVVRGMVAACCVLAAFSPAHGKWTVRTYDVEFVDPWHPVGVSVPNLIATVPETPVWGESYWEYEYFPRPHFVEDRFIEHVTVEFDDETHYVIFRRERRSTWVNILERRVSYFEFVGTGYLRHPPVTDYDPYFASYETLSYPEAVPEVEIYATMLAGLAGMGVAARRRPARRADAGKAG